MRVFRIVISVFIFGWSLFLWGDSFKLSLQVEKRTSDLKQFRVRVEKKYIENKKTDSLWVDSVYKSMTLDEQIGQLIMINVYSHKYDDLQYVHSVTNLIKTYKVSGLCFFQGGPVRQAILTNHWQSVSKIPMFVAIDGEWGLAMRLDSTEEFPKAMTLGAIQDNKLIYSMGEEIAKQCKRIGININFAPVVDVNNNPMNPVIGYRSFGEDPKNVALKGIAYMKGMQENGIIATAKHFPGHGDTDADSHYSLPVIKSSYSRLDTVELLPFKELIKSNVEGVMVGHLFVPALDTANNLPSTVSEKIISGLLKNKLKFKGLVITDALGMQGAIGYTEPGKLEVQSLIAGVDILLMPQDVPNTIKQIKVAIEKGELSKKDIENKCKKILLSKKKNGLNKYKALKIENIYTDLNSGKSKLVNRKLYENAITLLINNNNLLPLKNIDTLKLASVIIGDTSRNVFQARLNSYTKVDLYSISSSPSKEQLNKLLEKLAGYNLTIVSVHKTNNSPKSNYGVTSKVVDLINQIKANNKIILDIFANPYCLKSITNIQNIEALILSYQDKEIPQDVSAQLIFGGISAKGKLPVTASMMFPLNSGIQTNSIFRFKYTIPEDLNIASTDLKGIDTIVFSCIRDSVFPGCQILLAKDNEIFFQRSFGYFTYDRARPVNNDDLYDLASITKIAATTVSVMKLYDEGKIDLDKTLGNYLPYLKGSNKESLSLRRVMAHQAKLKAWIPFYLQTLVNGNLDTCLYRPVYSDEYPNKVAENIFLRKDYADTIFKRIADSPLRNHNTYVYSDLGFYLLMKIIESLSSEPLENYTFENFFKPLGMTTMCYRPLNYFPKERIVPTERDTVFRKQLLQGDVDDPGAAMLGGVSGHAGLFSNANDLAKLLQMFLQNGNYAGRDYIKKSTIKEFTSYQYPDKRNRRGLGFDKPVNSPPSKKQTCESTSTLSYGHSGYTGTYFWVEPKENFIYIFLSNRVYPDATNEKITSLDIRSNIHQVVYDAIKKSKSNVL
jgi:beta-N-acetylhexosaminidase